MGAKGKIGLILPEINSALDHAFLEGACDQGISLGYDVIVYTGIFNSLREVRFDQYIAGLENIYTLICSHHLNGVLFAADRFHTDEVIQQIFDSLRQTDAPCLVLGREEPGFPTFEAEEHSGMYQVTKHLIQRHGCRKLYCITGLPNHVSSMERLGGFLDACEEAGIYPQGSDVFYGHFWKDTPEQIGVQIASGALPCPDGIVCASDVMAAALVRSLTAHGIRVPEDLVVTGYDGGMDAAVCDPPLTTVQGRDRQYGAEAVCRLHTMMTGQNCACICPAQSVWIGKSCGCTGMKHPENDEGFWLEHYVYNQMQRNAEQQAFIATDFIHRMMEASDLQELSDRIDQVGHIFTKADWIDICLCRDWQGNARNPDDVRQYGFPEQMYLLLSKRFGGNPQSGFLFPTSQILPALQTSHDPHVLVLTSLHCDGQILGFTAMGFQDSRAVRIDETYVSWCDAVSNGLKVLQQRIRVQLYPHHLEQLETDPVTGMLNRGGFLFRLPEVTAGYLKAGNRCVLLLLTYYPDQINQLDPVAAIGEAIRSYHTHRLCCRIEDSIFAVLMPMQPGENEAASIVDLTAFVENSLRARFKIRQVPEFIDYTVQLTSTSREAVEQQLEQGVLQLMQQKQTVQNHYLDYKAQIIRMRRRMVVNPQLEWNISDIAEQLCISKSHLQRLYKQVFASSIKDDIISVRLKRAAQLLSHTDLRIREVALQCGYNNENHFMRQFREKTGMTATDYRKLHRQNSA